MIDAAHCYHRHRFPPEIISHAVWLYHRFCLSFRDVEDLLAERGIVVTHERIRQWCRKFGPDYARKFKSAAQTQRFLSVHGVDRNLFNLGRHRLRASNYRLLRDRAFATWTEVTAA